MGYRRDEGLAVLAFAVTSLGFGAPRSGAGWVVTRLIEEDP